MPKSEKWVFSGDIELNYGDNDLFVHCTTDGQGMIRFYNKALAGKSITAIVDGVERVRPLSLKNRQVWTCPINSIGRPYTLTVENKNKYVTIIIPGEFLDSYR